MARPKFPTGGSNDNLPGEPPVLPGPITPGPDGPIDKPRKFLIAFVEITSPPNNSEVGPGVTIRGTASFKEVTDRPDGSSTTKNLDDKIVKVELRFGSGAFTRANPAGILNWTQWSFHGLHGVEPVSESMTITAKVTAQITPSSAELTNETSIDIKLVREIPNLEVTNLAESKNPPWFVSIQGTSSDQFKVSKVEWRLNDSAPKLANNKSGDWSEWTANISLPNRNEQHKISMIATNNFGNSSKADEVISADMQPPVIVISQPEDNPHKELWTPDNSPSNPIILEVFGMAFDTNTAVEKVEGRHNDGALFKAENLSGDWSSWRIVVELDRSGTHFVFLTATDVVGNSNGDNPTKLTINVEEVL